MKRLVHLLPLLLGILACAIQPTAMQVASPAIPAPSTRAPAPILPSAAAAPTPDLGRRPMIWFNPLPPMQEFPGRLFIGSADFMDLFSPEAQWASAAGEVQVFELYGEWLGRDATDKQVRQLVSDLNRRGIAIALAGGALSPMADCTGTIEGFAGISEGVRIARRIRDAGGTAYFYAFDHAYDAGTSSSTPAECRIPPEAIAQQVLAFTKAIREIFPNIIFGDDITAQLNVDEIARWVQAYRSVTGKDLGFLHLDIDYGIPNWAQKAVQIEHYLRSEGIAFGLFYLGDGNAPSDEAWFTTAGERIQGFPTGCRRSAGPCGVCLMDRSPGLRPAGDQALYLHQLRQTVRRRSLVPGSENGRTGRQSRLWESSNCIQGGWGVSAGVCDRRRVQHLVGRWGLSPPMD